MKAGWEIKKVKDIASLITDGDWIESRHQSEDGIRLIQTGNVGNGVFKAKDDKPHYISEDTFNELGCTEIFAGDCLVSRLPEPVGRACIIPEISHRMITAVDCSIIRFKDVYLPKLFVYYTMSLSYQKDINNNTTGTTRKRISRKNLEQISIPIPPLSEQEQIVSELDLILGVIDKKKQQLKELDSLAQSIFYEMFGDPVENEKGWEVKPLKEVAPNKVYKGEVPSVNDKYWLLNLDMISSNTGDIIQKCYFDLEEIGNSTIVFNDDNVLYSKLRPYLNKVVAPNEIGYATSELIPLYPDKLALNRVFLASLLRSSIFVEYISSKVAGAKMPRVSMGDFWIFPVILPPLSLQQQFANKIELIEKQKELIKQSIKETETLFNSRMEYYFNS